MAKGISFSNSGLDVEQLVAMSMKPYTMKYDNLFKKKESQVWKKDIYSSINTALKDYNAALGEFKRQGTLAKRMATSTNASAISVDATGDATLMSHNISVSQVARNATLKTVNNAKASEITNPDGTTRTSTKLYELSGLTSLELENKITAGQGNDIAMSLEFGDGESVSTVKYTYQELYDDKTLNDLTSDIRKQGLNITASYDATNDSFSITNKKTGAANQIKVTADANGNKLLDQLKMGQYDGTNVNDTPLTHEDLAGTTPPPPGHPNPGEWSSIPRGVDAKVLIDGNNYVFDSNKIMVDNVQYTLNDVTAAGETVKVSVSQDTEAIVKTVQKFVDTYNTLIEKLNEQYFTTRPKTNQKTYEPLTDEEKEGMSEDAIKSWEKNGKTGLLYHDTILSDVMNSMRTAIYTPNSELGKYNVAGSIGISMGDIWSKDGTKLTMDKDYGKLKLDTEKLEKALLEDPDAVYQIIGSQRESLDSNGNVRVDSEGRTIYEDDEQGIAYRLENAMKKAFESVGGQCEEKRSTGALQGEDGYLFGKISTMEKSLLTMLRMMQEKEAQFYNKFNAMEQAVGNLQNSLGALSGITG